MKQLKFLLLAAGILVATIAFSQEIPRRVFNAGGGQADAANVELSWSIGQAGLAGTFSQPTVVLNTGFQQFDNLLVSTDEILSDLQCTVYPNPFKNEFYLDMTSADFSEVNIKLFDNYGKLLLEQHFNVNTAGFQKLIKTQSLPAGIYNLQVIYLDKTNKTTTNSFKMIKH